jgi:hypothetical protein
MVVHAIPAQGGPPQHGLPRRAPVLPDVGCAPGLAPQHLQGGELCRGPLGRGARPQRRPGPPWPPHGSDPRRPDRELGPPTVAEPARGGSPCYATPLTPSRAAPLPCRRSGSRAKVHSAPQHPGPGGPRVAKAHPRLPSVRAARPAAAGLRTGWLAGTVRRSQALTPPGLQTVWRPCGDRTSCVWGRDAPHHLGAERSRRQAAAGAAAHGTPGRRAPP